MIAIVVLLVPDLATGHSVTGSLVQIAVVAALTLLGFLSWLVTRWRLDGDVLQIESGLLRRQSLRFPLSQVQAIDVVRPGLARIFRVAELRLRLAGASGGTARLAYLREHEVEPLRAQLLARPQGAGAATTRAADDQDPYERVLASVPTARLAASILISDVGIMAELLLVTLIVAAIAAPTAAAAIIGSSAAAILGVFTLVWRRFNQEYRLTVAEAPDGLRLRSGLIALTAETIRPGRVQAVRMVEPFVWRTFGWCRLEVSLAGRQRSKGESQAQRGQLRAVLPVGSRELALALLERILSEIPTTQNPPPRRVRVKSPLRYRFLAWGRTDSTVVTTTGRLRRVTVWVPLGKVQALRRVQGPIQRRFGLASVHLNPAGRNLHATVRDRDVSEADSTLSELIALCRRARQTPSAPRSPGPIGARAPESSLGPPLSDA